MKVVHVSQPTTEGVARVVASLAADQVRRGWMVTVVCPPDGALAADATAAGAAHVSWRARRAPGPSVAAEAAALGRLLRHLDPDVVHLHSSKAGLAGRLVLRGRRPTVFQPHAWSFAAADVRTRRVIVSWERWAARWTTALICVSRGERRRGEEEAIRARYVTVPNGIDLERFGVPDDEGRRRARQALGLPANPLVLCVARLTRQKGQDLLLRAWPAVTASHRDARLVLVGDGPERAALEAASGPNVTFTGDRDDVVAWLEAADVVVLPSRWEGLSLSLLEALATGTCVVATDVEGMREALRDGGPPAGAVVPPGDVHALAEAVIARLDDPGLAHREGREGRRRVEDRYDVRRQRAAVAALYEQLRQHPRS